MSNREVASLTCKILSIYTIIQGINLLANVLTFSIAIPNQVAHESLIHIISPLITILFGILLWLLSDKLSVIMVKGETHLSEGTGISASDIQRVAFSVLGLFFLGNSLPKLISAVSNLYTIQSRGITISAVQILLSIGAEITQFIVGLGIFLGAKGLVNFIKSMRTAGLKREDDC